MMIGPTLDLPDAAITQHIAVVGATGSGKTYAIKSVVEKLLEARKRVIILDPTGAWWGLRVLADEVTPGFPITIFGGDHADVQITEEAGGGLGKLLAEQPISAILDMSNMGVGERHRFVQRFAEAVFQFNKSPVHLVIDEADEFAPQSGPPGTERMLGAIDRIVRRGRIKGFRVMLITQRPAVLNKNVLTQAATLIAMRLPAPQDRKAIEAWINGQADVDEGKKVMESLARLHRGEGWVWSPGHGVLARARFPKITTFDSSRTPEDGEELTDPTLQALDLAAIQATLGAAIEEAKDNDVGELRKKVKALQADLEAARRLPAQVAQPADIEDQIEKAVASAAAVVMPRAATIIDYLKQALSHAEQHHRFLSERAQRETPVPQAGSIPAGESYAEPPVRAENGSNFSDGAVGSVRARDRGALTTRRPAENGSARGKGTATLPPPTSGLNSTQQRILEAVGSWWVMGIKPTRAMVALLAGIDPNGGHFSNSIGPLGTRGYINQTPSGVELTTAGQKAVGAMEPVRLQTYHEAVWGVARNKNGRAGDILNQLICRGNKPCSCSEIGRTLDIDPDGGHFSNSIGPLSTLGLITRRSGVVTPTALLFPEGLT